MAQVVISQFYARGRFSGLVLPFFSQAYGRLSLFVQPELPMSELQSAVRESCITCDWVAVTLIVRLDFANTLVRCAENCRQNRKEPGTRKNTDAKQQEPMSRT